MVGAALGLSSNSMRDDILSDETTGYNLGAAISKLVTYCRANDWAGYDPYDALNSRIFGALPILNSRFPRLALIQAFKRSPINLRRVAFVPKVQNPKAIALFLASLTKLIRAGQECDQRLLHYFVDRLVALRSSGTSYWCWGYSFPWQTRTALVPRGAPNLVCTTFVADALLDAYELKNDERVLDMAVSAARYLVNDLYWSDGSTATFRYPLPSIRSRVHNANFLAAAFLCRVGKHTGDALFVKRALETARYSAAQQLEDGSWYYGEEASQRWIDNFHTGYNLCALQAISDNGITQEFAASVQRGFRFYCQKFLEPNGAVRYFHDSEYPVDVHCVAQSMITLITLKRLSEDNIARACSVWRWAMVNMWDNDGFFYYRKLRTCTIRTSYMRWSQAWMLLAMSSLLSQVRRRHDMSSRASRCAVGNQVLAPECGINQ